MVIPFTKSLIFVGTGWLCGCCSNTGLFSKQRVPALQLITMETGTCTMSCTWCTVMVYSHLECICLYCMNIHVVQGHHLKMYLHNYAICWNLQASKFLVNFSTTTLSKTTSQRGLDSPPPPASSATVGDDSSVKECAHNSYSCQSLFSFLERCVSSCTREERDPLLPGGPQVARAMLLALHAEVSSSNK